MELKNFLTDADTHVNVEGCHYQGTIRTTYDTLERVFGEPAGGDGEKTTAQWRILFADGTVATVYDYHYNGRPKTPYDEYEWHIGGLDEYAVSSVFDAIEGEINSGELDII